MELVLILGEHLQGTESWGLLLLFLLLKFLLDHVVVLVLFLDD